MSETKLNPCPLCGNKDLNIHKPSFDIYGDLTFLEQKTYISCNSCNLFLFGDAMWADGALEGCWNRRSA